MGALKELFTTSVGLLSLAVIVLVITMGFWFSYWFNRQIERERRERSAAGERSGTVERNAP